MRYPSCLTVAPSAMDATLGGRGGITPDPCVETGRRYIWYEERAENNIIIIGQERVWDYTWWSKRSTHGELISVNRTDGDGLSTHYSSQG